MGAVQPGDYIVAKGEVPGFGIAVHPKDMIIDDFKLAVGRSWEQNKNAGPKMVNTVVGVHNNDFLNILKTYKEKFDKTDERLKVIEEKLNISGKNSTPEKKAF
jgi:hypothetical protein